MVNLTADYLTLYKLKQGVSSIINIKIRFDKYIVSFANFVRRERVLREIKRWCASISWRRKEIVFFCLRRWRHSNNVSTQRKTFLIETESNNG